MRDALLHLYDPNYQPPQQLWSIMNCNPKQSVETLQSAIVQAIKNLEPEPKIPSSARIRRLYNILAYRFIQGLTQDETAQMLNLSLRHVRREQKQAIGMLARRLWGQKYVGTPSTDKPAKKALQPPEVTKRAVEPTTWRSQVQQELAALQKSAPGIVADVEEVISGVAKLAGTLISENNISLKVEPGSPNLTAAIHPSALDQILITAIEKLTQHMSSGQIILKAERDGETVVIVIAGHPVTAEKVPESDLIWEVVTTLEGSVEVRAAGNMITFELRLPSSDKVKVLVVDDNTELVHFYRRYTWGTRYQIVHLAEGRRAFETIEDSPPELIVLDVMLPDIDGWELLRQMRKHSATKSTPIIVCSVVRREELALALGATMYICKPVGYQQFVQALDQALTQVAT